MSASGGAGGLPANLGALLDRVGGGSRPTLIDLRQPEAPLELTADMFQRRLEAFADGIVDHLATDGSGEVVGRRIGFLTENRWEALIGYLAAMYAGAVAVPINHKLPPDTVAHIVADAEVDLVFHDKARAPLVPTGTPNVDLDDETQLAPYLPTPTPTPTPTPALIRARAGGPRTSPGPASWPRSSTPRGPPGCPRGCPSITTASCGPCPSTWSRWPTATRPPGAA